MTDESVQAMPHDYWESVEEYAEESGQIDPAPGVSETDLEMSIREIVESRTDDMWTIIGIVVADSDPDGTLFLIVHRYGVGDSGDLLLDERYYTLDPRDPFRDGCGYSSNGITRNVSGSGMLLSQKLMFSIISNEELGDPQMQLLEADNGQVVHQSDLLKSPLRELLGLEDDETVECMRCGGEMDPEEDEIVVMDGDLGEIQIHDPDAGGCPDE